MPTSKTATPFDSGWRFLYGAGVFCLLGGKNEGQKPAAEAGGQGGPHKLLTLRVEPRGLTKSARSNARRSGCVPAVLYGKGLNPTPLMVSEAAMRETLKQGGKHRLIRLEGAGLNEAHTVLIQDVQYDGVHNAMVHVDFFQPPKGKRIRVRVPVVVQGEDALTRRGIILNHQLNEVEVNCMPESVPAGIYVDVSAYDPGDHVSVSDLTVPEGAKLVSAPEMVVLSIEPPMATIIPGEGAANVTTAG
jgi:large subunit ribosomal protein L25